MTLINMSYETQCYIYWRRLCAIWMGCDGDGDDGLGIAHGDSSSRSESHRQRTEETEALRTFLHNKLKRRQAELGERYRAVAKSKDLSLLKALVAPYLGFEIPLDLLVKRDRDEVPLRLEKGRKSEGTKKIFDKLWNNTMTRGKIATVLCESLGWGSLAIVKRTR